MVHGLATLKRLNDEAQARHDAKKTDDIPAQALLIQALVDAHKRLTYMVGILGVACPYIVKQITNNDLPQIERALKAAGFLDVL